MQRHFLRAGFRPRCGAQLCARFSSLTGGPRGGRLLSGLFGIAALLAGQHAAAQSQAEAQTNPAETFLAQADQVGVRQCAGVFAELGNALTFGSTFAVQTQADGEAPDAHAAQGLVGRTYADPTYSGQAAGIVMAAPVGQGCEGQMVRVAPFQQSCQEVVGMLPPGSTAAETLSGVWLYALGEGEGEGQAMLLPSGASCVVVTVVGGATVQ